MTKRLSASLQCRSYYWQHSIKRNYSLYSSADISKDSTLGVFICECAFVDEIYFCFSIFPIEHTPVWADK